MWVFTQDGFISAVDNGFVPGKLAIRARDRQSLKLLAATTNEEVIKLQHTDYPYRVHVTKEQFAEFLTSHVEDLDYPNFKNQVYDVRGKTFARACSKVWDAMLDVTDADAVGTGLYS